MTHTFFLACHNIISASKNFKLYLCYQLCFKFKLFFYLSPYINLKLVDPSVLPFSNQNLLHSSLLVFFLLESLLFVGFCSTKDILRFIIVCGFLVLLILNHGNWEAWIFELVDCCALTWCYYSYLLWHQV